MSRHSESLRIVESPHRAIPDDLERYQGPREVSHCEWCEFQAGAGGWCTSPVIVHRVRVTARKGTRALIRAARDVTEGDFCPGYRPSLRTRLARIFGLRKPVLR